MNSEELKNYLIERGACETSIKYCENKSSEQAWDECQDPEWMLWVLDYSKHEHTERELRLIAVEFARMVQHLMKDERSIRALEVAERYANGQATEEELANARSAARAAGRDGWAAESAAKEHIGTILSVTARAAEVTAKVLGGSKDDASKLMQCNIIRKFIPKPKLIL